MYTIYGILMRTLTRAKFTERGEVKCYNRLWLNFRLKMMNTVVTSVIKKEKRTEKNAGAAQI